MLVFVGIYIGQRLAEISVSEREHISIYDQTTYEFNTRLIVGAKLDEIISDLKLKYKHSLIKIYVVCDESLNIDPNLIADPLIHLLNFNDIDFTHYLSKEVDPKKKIVFVNKNSMLYEYVNTKNRILEYKPMKCFEGPFVKENYLKLMLQFFECELHQLHFYIFEPHVQWDSNFNYLEIFKKENKNFSSYTVFTFFKYSQKAIVYGRYLLNDNIKSLLKLPQCFSLDEIQLNTFNFELCKIIPSSRAIETYKPQTRLMGIDLGASRIVVSVSRNGHTELVKIDQEYSMPSVISFVEDEPIVGNVAVRHLAKNPELVLCDFEDLSDKRKNLSGYSLPFGQLIESKKSSFVFQSKELLKQFSTIEIYEILLQKLKQEASEFQFDLNEGKDVNQVVITVPNFDNDLMLKDIFAAAESVGLKILDIVTETHADLLYFLSNKQFSIGETVAVVDIGGGTGFIEKFSFKKGFHEKLDFSFLCAREINTHLEWALELLFYERFEIWPTFNAEQKLEVEKIKENFTFAEKFSVPSSLIQNEDVVLTRNWFESVLDRIFHEEKNREVIEILKDESYSSNISKVFLVGGTCRIPYIQKYLAEIFGEDKVIIPNDLQGITATGALIHGLKLLDGEHQPVFQKEKIEQQSGFNDILNEPIKN